MIEYEAVPVKKGSSRGIYISAKNIDEARAKIIALASKEKGDVAYELNGYFNGDYKGTLVVSKMNGAYWKNVWNYTPVQNTPFRKVNPVSGKLSSKAVFMPEFSKYVRRS